MKALNWSYGQFATKTNVISIFHVFLDTVFGDCGYVSREREPVYRVRWGETMQWRHSADSSCDVWQKQPGQVLLCPLCLCVEKSAVFSKSHGTHSLVVLECKGASDVYWGLQNFRSKLAETCRIEVRGIQMRVIKWPPSPLTMLPECTHVHSCWCISITLV